MASVEGRNGGTSEAEEYLTKFEGHRSRLFCVQNLPIEWFVKRFRVDPLGGQGIGMVGEGVTCENSDEKSLLTFLVPPANSLEPCLALAIWSPTAHALYQVAQMSILDLFESLFTRNTI
jgi:hypothetical protein